ncbi:MAG: hypothetical protein DMG70_20575 [Acidobacteria bacterium]|nr:MAG: hypothetical protein DMG70_20575 [Acidobacteriota bacterium]PYY04856.1 MAG: hypothetical protein DMG69_28735 [Acidobacteriota bacterium]
MLTAKRKLLLLTSFTLLMSLGWAGCHGFFVKPTLTGITVTTLQATNLPTQGSTIQLMATGAYDDGSHKNLSGVATWSKTDPQNLVTLSTSSPGLVTANAAPNPGVQVTIQAAAQSSNGSVVSGTITLTVGQSSTLTISSSRGSTISLSGAGGAGATVTFSATLNGTDVTNSTTFTSSSPSVIAITTGSTGTLQATGTTTITGSDSSNGASGTLQITVNP